MTQHYTSSTVSASHYCGKCGKFTQHRIDNGRKGPCLDCIERLNVEHAKAKPAPAEQGVLLFTDQRGNSVFASIDSFTDRTVAFVDQALAKEVR